MAGSVLGWRCAPGINNTAHFVTDYPNPDEVNRGVFDDDWLLNAVTMVATAAMKQMFLKTGKLEPFRGVKKKNSWDDPEVPKGGGVENNLNAEEKFKEGGAEEKGVTIVDIDQIDGSNGKGNKNDDFGDSNGNNGSNENEMYNLALCNQMMRIFVGHMSDEGEFTYHTEVGAYCVRLHKNGVWNVVIIDDLFPMLRKDRWTTENRGLAVAHTTELTSLWVTLIEKAYAKYYGSYSMLDRGCIHHALSDLTGCESDCVLLTSAARGIDKTIIWDSLLEYSKCSFILSGMTNDPTQIDKDTINLGISCNTNYIIDEVRTCHGHKLIKFRRKTESNTKWKGIGAHCGLLG